MFDKSYTTGQVAKFLQCAPRTVVKICDSGLLPYYRIGRDRRIRRSQLVAYLLESGNQNAVAMLPPVEVKP